MLSQWFDCSASVKGVSCFHIAHYTTETVLHIDAIHTRKLLRCIIRTKTAFSLFLFFYNMFYLWVHLNQWCYCRGFPLWAGDGELLLWSLIGLWEKKRAIYKFGLNSKEQCCCSFSDLLLVQVWKKKIAVNTKWVKSSFNEASDYRKMLVITNHMRRPQTIVEPRC